MATYVTYDNGTSIITILNFVFVENFDNIRNVFQNYEGYDDNLFDDDQRYIAIKNEDRNYNPAREREVNYQNLSVCASNEFPRIRNRNESINFSQTDLRDIWRNPAHPMCTAFTLSGTLNDCKIKKILAIICKNMDIIKHDLKEYLDCKKPDIKVPNIIADIPKVLATDAISIFEKSYFLTNMYNMHIK